MLSRKQQIEWLDQRMVEAKELGILVKWANDGHIVFVANEPNGQTQSNPQPETSSSGPQGR
jgi:hypothetical protein